MQPISSICHLDLLSNNPSSLRHLRGSDREQLKAAAIGVFIFLRVVISKEPVAVVKSRDLSNIPPLSTFLPLLLRFLALYQAN